MYSYGLCHSSVVRISLYYQTVCNILFCAYLLGFLFFFSFNFSGIDCYLRIGFVNYICLRSVIEYFCRSPVSLSSTIKCRCDYFGIYYIRNESLCEKYILFFRNCFVIPCRLFVTFHLSFKLSAICLSSFLSLTSYAVRETISPLLCSLCLSVKLIATTRNYVNFIGHVMSRVVYNKLSYCNNFLQTSKFGRLFIPSFFQEFPLNLYHFSVTLNEFSLTLTTSESHPQSQKSISFRIF